jgi:HAD superfamily hydrolase (TIGR01509 family)
MPSLLFGSISTLADTSEVQREAFNRAFADHGLDWRWDQDEYRAMLGSNGGAARIAAYASDRDERVDPAAVHATKSERFHELLAEGRAEARPGVVDTIEAARSRGVPVGVATTTSPANVAAVLAAIGVPPTGLAVVLDAEQVDQPKPAPEVYTTALARLGGAAGQAVAIEDNPGGIASARAAGVTCVAFPNENTVGLDFTGAAVTITRVDLDQLLSLVDA